MSGLHIQLPWESGHTIWQQRIGTRNPKTQGQAENIRMLPLRYRCRCLPRTPFHCWHRLEKRTISSRCYIGARLNWRAISSHPLFSLNSYDYGNNRSLVDAGCLCDFTRYFCFCHFVGILRVGARQKSVTDATAGFSFASLQSLSYLCGWKALKGVTVKLL